MFVYESSSGNTGILASFFKYKLDHVQKLVHVIRPKHFPDYDIDLLEIVNQSRRTSKQRQCTKCAIKYFYRLGNIIWPNNLYHKISHNEYPSEYFITIIQIMEIFDDYIINPPIIISHINSFSVIPFHYNKLQILDSLAAHGSTQGYIIPDKSCELGKKCSHNYIYSEHSGVINIENNQVENIIVSTNSNRISDADSDIYLPTNTAILEKYPYIYHTHPLTNGYGGRVDSGILYEFPSTSDIYNFVFYYTNGIVQASIIVAPEGMYILRLLEYEKGPLLDKNNFDKITRYIMRVEKKAIIEYRDILENITEDDFHTIIGANIEYIRMLNQLMHKYNIHIEYYPRVLRNGIWSLRQINLQYIED